MAVSRIEHDDARIERIIKNVGYLERFDSLSLSYLSSLPYLDNQPRLEKLCEHVRQETKSDFVEPQRVTNWLNSTVATPFSYTFESFNPKSFPSLVPYKDADVVATLKCIYILLGNAADSESGNLRIGLNNKEYFMKQDHPEIRKVLRKENIRPLDISMSY